MSQETKDPWAAFTLYELDELKSPKECRCYRADAIDAAIAIERASHAAALAEKDAEIARLKADAQLLADIRSERADDYSKSAMDECDECGELVMCSYHSVLSALFGGTWTQPAIDRARLAQRKEQPK